MPDVAGVMAARFAAQVQMLPRTTTRAQMLPRITRTPLMTPRSTATDGYGYGAYGEGPYGL
jgi:hypothetical protein